jgi:hypothetical protein
MTSKKGLVENTREPTQKFSRLNLRKVLIVTRCLTLLRWEIRASLKSENKR